MATRFEPPHDRVTLSLDELRALEQLEQTFAEPAFVEASAPVETTAAAESCEPSRLRRRALAGCLRWVRLAPWLIPIGIVLTLATLTSSVVVSVVGVVLTGIGFTACIGRMSVRAPLVHARRRWRRFC